MTSVSLKVIYRFDDVNDINDEAKTQLTDNKEEGEE